MSTIYIIEPWWIYFLGSPFLISSAISPSPFALFSSNLLSSALFSSALFSSALSSSAWSPSALSSSAWFPSALSSSSWFSSGLFSSSSISSGLFSSAWSSSCVMPFRIGSQGWICKWNCNSYLKLIVYHSVVEELEEDLEDAADAGGHSDPQVDLISLGIGNVFLGFCP